MSPRAVIIDDDFAVGSTPLSREAEAAFAKTRWAAAWTAISMAALGGCAALGLCYAAFAETSRAHWAELLAFAVTILGFGSAWGLTAWSLWQYSYRRLTLAPLVAVEPEASPEVLKWLWLAFSGAMAFVALVFLLLVLSALFG